MTTERKLTLLTLTTNPDGSVTVEADQAPRCDRCRHWGKGDHWGSSQRSVREEQGFEEADSCEVVGAGVNDYAAIADGAVLRLYTRPDFCCSLFEPCPEPRK